MAGDRYAFNPLFLSPEYDFSSEQNILESVPVSQFQAYLEATYGPGVPSSRPARYTVEQFFAAATTYSTDESLAEILESNLSSLTKVQKYIPRWLQLVEPIVKTTHLLDKEAENQLHIYENSNILTPPDQELPYAVGIFFCATQMSSTALDVPHPSQQRGDLLRPLLKRGGTPAAGVADEPLPQTILLRTPVVKTEHLRKAEKLKAETRIMNGRVMRAAERMVAILSSAQAKQELDKLLDGPVGSN